MIGFLEGGVSGAAAELEKQLFESANGDIPGRTLAELALFKTASADLGGAREAAERAAQVDFDDLAATTLRRSVQALLALYECRMETAVEIATDAVALAELETDDGAGMQAHRYHPTFFLATALTDADAFDEAEEALHRGRRLCDELGTFWAPPLYHGLAANRLLKMGNWDDAVAEAEAALDFVTEFDMSVSAVWPHALLARISLLRHDLDGAGEALERGERELAEKGLQFGTDLLVLTRAELLQETGAVEPAVELLGLAWAQADELGLGNVHRVLGPPLARMLVACGQVERALEVGATLQELALRSDVPSVHAAALQCRGLPGRDPDLLLRATEKWRQGPRPLELAEACLDAALALTPAGRRQEAVALLDEADTLARQLGATRLAHQVAAHLPARRRGRSASPARARSGWQSLTPSEEKVVRLLGQGMSNGQIAERLFVSRRTIESHLYRIFTKLGVASRVELAVQAAARLQ